jgi:hypothetical protein
MRFGKIIVVVVVVVGSFREFGIWIVEPNL